MPRPCLLSLVLLLSACTSGPGSDGRRDETDADDTSEDDSSQTGPPVCYDGCSVAADCTLTGAGAAYDTDNYRCDDGACAYTGCNTSAECVDTLGAGHVCHVTSWGFDQCTPVCAVPADCEYAGSGAAYDADNYACPSGACEYTGCNGNPECQSTFGSDYVCHTPDTGLAYCVPGCTIPADCGWPAAGLAYDADNYDCDAGACVYTGCNGDGECRDSLADDALCR